MTLERYLVGLGAHAVLMAGSAVADGQAVAGAQADPAAQSDTAAPADSAVNEDIEDVLVIGRRRAGNTAEESPVPVDVISGVDFLRSGNTGDISDNLRFNVPSFNATIASGDGDTFVRPTSLRGLAPDQALVMVNGKRRHRAALIAEFVPAAGKGAHAPNMGMIPGIALERVEVLRDGASAQYGSDAIAGVINLVTRTEGEGGEIRMHYGQFYEGEQSYSIAGNVGLPLTDRGFLNVSVEYAVNQALSRGVQTANGQALIDAGVPGVGQDTPFHDAPLTQSWGRAYTENVRMFFTAGTQIGDDVSLYAQSNYADTFGRYRFFFRHQEHITLRTLRDEHGFDGLPAGFTPYFDGDQEDFSFVGGIRGGLDTGLNYDFSAGYGFNEIDFFLNNTVNQSLGLGADRNPAQRDFDVGDLQQEELSLNADFTRPLTESAHLAFGAEWREETFTVVPGEPAAYFGAGSSGFKGFEPQNAGDFSRHNYALYGEIEQNLSANFQLQYAARYEDFSDFGDTLNGKVAARYDAAPNFALRAAVSTGFHAPTPGQANIQKITTTFDNDLGLQVESGTVPPDHPLAAAAGGSPLTEEQSTNFSIGVVSGFGAANSIAVDAYRIDVDDRIFKTQNLPTFDPVTGVGSNVQFFTNALGLEVSGVDLVLAAAFDWRRGGVTTGFNVAYNRNKVDVVRQRTVNGVLPVSAASVEDIEQSYPRDRVTLTTSTSSGGHWDLLVRLNYFGPHYDERGRIGGVDGSPPTKRLGSTFFVDVEFAYEVSDAWRLVLGGANLFDDYVDRVEPPYANRLHAGLVYARRTATNFEGGSWYVRVVHDW